MAQRKINSTAVDVDLGRQMESSEYQLVKSVQGEIAIEQAREDPIQQHIRRYSAIREYLRVNQAFPEGERVNAVIKSSKRLTYNVTLAVDLTVRTGRDNPERITADSAGWSTRRRRRRRRMS